MQHQNYQREEVKLLNFQFVNFILSLFGVKIDDPKTWAETYNKAKAWFLEWKDKTPTAEATQELDKIKLRALALAKKEEVKDA